MPGLIEDYAIIGDCETAALVGRDGSIDWLALPRFDSAACFAALLGGPENGRWLIAPAAQDAKATRRYREGTLVLETSFETAEGSAVLVDGMGRRADGATYREMLERLAEESGITTPTAEDLIRLDRKRKGKRLSNAEWASPTDPEAKIAKLKDGRTHLAYKPEHAVDLDTGAIVAAEVHPADRGDTATLPGTLAAAEANLAAVDAAPTPEDPAELIADKGYRYRWRSRLRRRGRR